jgi:hypothetical protein
MSYILNALKKAERDRKREEIEDLDDFVSDGWDPYQEPTESHASYKVAAIILFVAALLFLVFYSLTNQVVSDAEPVSEPPQVVEVPNQPLEQEAVKQEPLRQESVTQELVIQEPVQKQQVPQELQLPEVTIAGHIYIRSGSPKNRIFIGDRTYYVGDSIDSDWVIESINFDSLSVRSGALSSELPLR